MSRDSLPQRPATEPTISQGTIVAYGITWHPKQGCEGIYTGTHRDRDDEEIELRFVISPNMASRPELAGDHTNPNSMHTKEHFIVNKEDFYAYNKEFTDSNNIKWKCLGHGTFNIVYETTLLEAKTLGNVAYPASTHLVYRIPLEAYTPLALTSEDVRLIAQVNSSRRTVRILNEIRVSTNAEARYPLATLYGSGLISPFFDGNNIQDPMLLRDILLEFCIRTGRLLFDGIVPGNIKDNGLAPDISFALRSNSPDSEAYLSENSDVYDEFYFDCRVRQKIFPAIQITKAMAYLRFKFPHIDSRQLILLKNNARVITALAAAYDSRNPETLLKAKVEAYFNPGPQRSPEEEERAQRELAPDGLMAKIELRNKITEGTRLSYKDFKAINTTLFTAELSDRKRELISMLADANKEKFLDVLKAACELTDERITDVFKLLELKVPVTLINEFIAIKINFPAFRNKLEALCDHHADQFPKIMALFCRAFQKIGQPYNRELFKSVFSRSWEILHLETVQQISTALIFLLTTDIDNPRQFVIQFLGNPVSPETTTFVEHQMNKQNGQSALRVFAYLIRTFEFPENAARETIEVMSSDSIAGILTRIRDARSNKEALRKEILEFLTRLHSRPVSVSTKEFAENQIRKRNDAISVSAAGIAGLMARPPSGPRQQATSNSLFYRR